MDYVGRAYWAVLSVYVKIVSISYRAFVDDILFITLIKIKNISAGMSYAVTIKQLTTLSLSLFALL